MKGAAAAAVAASPDLKETTMTDVPMDESTGEPITPDDAAIGGVPTSAEGSLATDSGLVDDETGEDETGSEATGDEVDTETSGESPVERGL